MKIRAAMSVESVSKRPKKRDFARLYWSEEFSLDIGLNGCDSFCFFLAGSMSAKADDHRTINL
jgi:hypothetical protein